MAPREHARLKRELIRVIQSLSFGWLIASMAIYVPGRMMHPAFAIFAGVLTAISLLRNAERQEGFRPARSDLQPQTQLVLLCLAWVVAAVTWTAGDLRLQSHFLQWAFVAGFTIAFRDGLRWVVSGPWSVKVS